MPGYLGGANGKLPQLLHFKLGRQMRQKEKLWIEPSHRYDAHQFPEVSDDFRLADGRPLWYALLNDPNVLVMEAAEANTGHEPNCGSYLELNRISYGNASADSLKKFAKRFDQ
jgi:hypothetical protein